MNIIAQLELDIAFYDTTVQYVSHYAMDVRFTHGRIWLWYTCPVGWGCIIHWLLLFREVRPPPNVCPVYDTKQSDGEGPVILEFWGMLITPLLPSLPGIFWPGLVVPDRVQSMGQIELKCVLMLNWITWKRTVLIFKLRTYAKLKCLK